MTQGHTHQDNTIPTEGTAAEAAAQQPERGRTRVGHRTWFVRLAVNLCRLVLGGVFVVSGYVKAVDPLGTQYKLQDYLAALGMPGAVPDFATLAAAIALSTLEFALGVFTLFAIRRRQTARVALLFMVVMTLVTVWIWVANPVKDCGCFGDFIVLTNGQTLAKNIVLLLCAATLCRWPLAMYRFISRTNQWIAINFTVLFVIVTSLYCLYTLPIFDFRPYHVGVNVPRAMEMPEGAEQPQFETTFVMEKGGVRREFSLDDYPDSTWQFIDSKTVQTRAGYVPPIHDFAIQRAEGDDITDEVLSRRGYLFLLVSPHLGVADDTNFSDIDQLYEYAQQEKVPFYCLTASTEREIQHWENLTGAEYPFYLTDETTLKTIIRSNPGLLLLKDGTIIRKWSHNRLPDADELHGPLATLEIGHMPDDTVGKTITQVLLWFFVPLMVLTLADRTWAWSQFLRRKARLLDIRRRRGQRQES